MMLGDGIRGEGGTENNAVDMSRIDTLAVELIKEVGAGKDFLAKKHTREYMNAEQSKVKLLDRRMRGAWKNRGGKDLAEAAAEEARHLLKTHKPAPLPSDPLPAEPAADRPSGDDAGLPTEEPAADSDTEPAGDGTQP